jgi:hypothetical protein
MIIYDSTIDSCGFMTRWHSGNMARYVNHDEPIDMLKTTSYSAHMSLEKRITRARFSCHLPSACYLTEKMAANMSSALSSTQKYHGRREMVQTAPPISSFFIIT